MSSGEIMFNDARALEPGAHLEAEVCVVGGGAAGLTVAQQLANTQVSVLVLESGGSAPDEATDALSTGTAVGRLLGRTNHYLTASRTRRLGGLANAWHGTCRPLDAEDLSGRTWVPESGWPLDRAALEPYYERAGALLGLDLPAAPAPGELLTDSPRFASSWLAYAPGQALGPQWRQHVAAAPNVEILTHATVTSLELDGAGSLVQSATVSCLDGPSFEVRARHFVLAAGTLENARLLLASNGRRTQGLGNSHDLVGRFFMDQPLLHAGYVSLPGGAGAMARYAEPAQRPGRRGILRATPDFQKRHELLNALALFAPAKSTAGGPLAAAVRRCAAGLRRLAGDEAGAGDYFAALVLRGEQRPNPDSRLVLGPERDALGVPQISLDWQIDDHDRWSLSTTARLLGEDLGQRRLGRLQLHAGQSNATTRRPRRRIFTWSGHQSGTTRMSRGAASGVVNPNCRVYDVPNLFVAGSAVFPTSGCSGPMLTTVALALRLGDHLRQLLDA